MSTPVTPKPKVTRKSKKTEEVVVPSVTPSVPETVVAPSIPAPPVAQEPQVTLCAGEVCPLEQKGKRVRHTLSDHLLKLTELKESAKTLIHSDASLSKDCMSHLNKVFDQINVVNRSAKQELRPKKTVTKRPNIQSGITKPVSVTPEMSNFAGWPVGEQHSRVDISKAILKYINDNKLQNAEKKKRINPDEHLTKLLSYNEAFDGPLEYTSIQKLIGRIIVKTTA